MPEGGWGRGKKRCSELELIDCTTILPSSRISHESPRVCFRRKILSRGVILPVKTLDNMCFRLGIVGQPKQILELIDFSILIYIYERVHNSRCRIPYMVNISTMALVAERYPRQYFFECSRYTYPSVDHASSTAAYNAIFNERCTGCPKGHLAPCWEATRFFPYFARLRENAWP